MVWRTVGDSRKGVGPLGGAGSWAGSALSGCEDSHSPPGPVTNVRSRAGDRAQIGPR